MTHATHLRHGRILFFHLSLFFVLLLGFQLYPELVFAAENHIWQKVEDHPDFRLRYRQAAECLLLREGHKTGTFYFPKIRDRWVDDHMPWVYWVEGNELFLFEAYRTGTPFYDLSQSRRRLHLARDVVEKQSDIGTSSYLVDRAWANLKIAEAKQGTFYNASVENVLQQECSSDPGKLSE